MDEFATNYLEELRVQRRASPHTITAYRHDLILLFQMSAAQLQGKNPSSFEAIDIRKLIISLHSQGLGARSIARTLSSWRGFYRYLGLRGLIPKNPAEGIRPPKMNRPLPHTLSIDEANLLFHQQAESLEDTENTEQTKSALTKENANYRQLRNTAMFELFYSSGLRLAELTALNVDCLSDLNNGEIRVLGKRSKWRVVPVGSKAISAILLWVNARVLVAKNDELALFVGARGARIHIRLIASELENYAKEQGLLQHVHPHMLRHSFASHMLQASGDLRAVQEMLGHASIASTQIYTHLDFEHLSKIYDAAHPRAKRK